MRVSGKYVVVRDITIGQDDGSVRHVFTAHRRETVPDFVVEAGPFSSRVEAETEARRLTDLDAIDFDDEWEGADV